jgi:hypothetical protein
MTCYCGKPLIGRRDKQYCSETCRRRESQRRYVRRHKHEPKFIERNRAKNKRQRAANPEKYRAKGRERYYKNVVRNRSRSLARYYQNRDKRLLYASLHRDRSREAFAKWRKKNPERMRQLIRDYMQRHKSKLYAKWKARRDALCDAYVKQVIHIVNHVPSSQIPPDIVELKRNQLRLLRAVRNRGKEVKNAYKRNQSQVALLEETIL